MKVLLRFQDMASFVAGNELDDICGVVKRNTIMDICSQLLGLSRHTCLLYWKGYRISPNSYSRMVCFYACKRFEWDMGVRMKAVRGVELCAHTRWEVVDNKIVGVSCVMDGVVHFTLLFDRYEDLMGKCGVEADCRRTL